MSGFNGEPTIDLLTADAAITQWAAVVLVVATEDHCNLPAGANSALFGGFATHAAASGDVLQVVVEGKTKGKLGSSCDIGDYLMINGALGDLKPVVLGSSDQYAVAQALRGGSTGDVIPLRICRFIAQHT